MSITKQAARFVVGALLALGLVGGFIWVVLDPPDLGDGGGSSPTAVSGEARLGPGEKRTSVRVAGEIGGDATAVAQFARTAPAGLRVRATTRARDVVLILNKRAPAAVKVAWTVDGVTVQEGSADGVDVLPVAALTIAGGGLFLAAYLLTHISASGSILFAAFAKVFGLLLISGVGLIGAILASRADDDETFTALFTLLGLVAGYIAGTRTEPQTEDDATTARDDDEAGDDRAEGGSAERPSKVAGGSTRLRTSTARSLL